MSLNTAMNAVLAILEDRAELARDILRSPNSDITDINTVMTRVYMAVDKEAINAIKQVLRAALTLQPPDSMTSVEKEAFYQGIKAIEELLDKKVNGLNAYA